MNRILARRFRSTAVYALIGVLIGPLVGLLTGVLDEIPLVWPSVRGAIAGLVIGTAVGSGEEFLLPYASRRLSFFRLNVLRFGGYLIVILGTLLVVNVARLVVGSGQSVAGGTVFYLGEGLFARDLALAVVAAFAILSVLQLRRLHHASELWRLVTGRYHYPEEEELVFLFVDLARSTTIAERLGHMGFSRLLRDMFADISEPILAWRGRVYQHLGDGVIVTWTTRALHDGAAVRCFFDMIAHLASHREHYEESYGLVPTVRGAAHVGPVVTTWVGEAKKELAYHGDTLNATARMLDACKRLGVDFLVSERLRLAVEGSDGLAVWSVGEVELEGKSAAPILYAVDRAGPSA